MITISNNKVVGSVNFKTLLITIGLYVFISACQANSYTENVDLLTVAKLDKLALEVYNRKGQCEIRLNGSRKGKLLNIPYPCGFVRSGRSLVAQTYHYSGVGQIFIVAGPVADEKYYKAGGSVKPKHMCSNQGQAIIIHNGKLIFRQSQNIPLGFCHSLGFDEKDYYGFAFPVD